MLVLSLFKETLTKIVQIESIAFSRKIFDLIQSTFGFSNIWTKFSHNRWHECVEVLLLLKVHKGDWKVIHNKFWSINNVEFHFVLSATAGIVIFWCLVNSFLTDTHISLQKVNLRTNWYFKSWFFFRYWIKYMYMMKHFRKSLLSYTISFRIAIFAGHLPVYSCSF